MGLWWLTREEPDRVVAKVVRPRLIRIDPMLHPPLLIGRKEQTLQLGRVDKAADVPGSPIEDNVSLDALVAVCLGPQMPREEATVPSAAPPLVGNP